MPSSFASGPSLSAAADAALFQEAMDAQDVVDTEADQADPGAGEGAAVPVVGPELVLLPPLLNADWATSKNPTAVVSGDQAPQTAAWLEWLFTPAAHRETPPAVAVVPRASVPGMDTRVDEKVTPVDELLVSLTTSAESETSTPSSDAGVPTSAAKPDAALDVEESSAKKAIEHVDAASDVPAESFAWPVTLPTTKNPTVDRKRQTPSIGDDVTTAPALPTSTSTEGLGQHPELQASYVPPELALTDGARPLPRHNSVTTAAPHLQPATADPIASGAMPEPLHDLGFTKEPNVPSTPQAAAPNPSPRGPSLAVPAVDVSSTSRSQPSFVAAAIATSVGAVVEGQPSDPPPDREAPHRELTAAARLSSASTRLASAMQTMASFERALAASGPAQESPHSAPTLPNERAVASSIVQSMRMQYRDGIGTAVVNLDPTFLGGVRISLQVAHGAVTATLKAENPDVRAWIEANEATLRQGLVEQGLSLDRLIVSEDHAAEEQAQRDGRRRSPEEPPEPPRRTRRRDESVTFEVVV